MTLLELMISLALGLLLLTGIGTIYMGSNQTYRVQEENARIQESGRFALEVIGRSLRQAGSWEMPLNTNIFKTAFVGTRITGTHNAGPPVVDTVTTQYDGVAGDRDCEGTVVTAAMVAAATPPGSIVVTDAYRRDAANLELECDGIDVDNAFQPLVSNVEDLQILYGIDNDGGVIPSANRYTATPGNWNQVVSVRVCVLIRSEQAGITTLQAGSTTQWQRYLNCAGALGTATGAAAFTDAADSRLHRAFVSTFNLRNRVLN
jgi:type IV pilus assembly protein PilW